MSACTKSVFPILYINWFSPPCHAVLLTAKFLGVKVEEKDVDFFKEEHLSDAFKKINPAHTIPAMDDNGLRIWESRAIMGYLVHQYGKNDDLYPRDPKRRAHIDNMLYFDATTLYSSFASYYYPLAFNGKPEDAEMKEKFFEKVAIFEGILSDREFAAGDKLSLADISAVVSISTFLAAGVDVKKYPNTQKWMQRVKASIPIYGEVMDQGYKNYVAVFKDHRIK